MYRFGIILRVIQVVNRIVVFDLLFLGVLVVVCLASVDGYFIGDVFENFEID
ncbi:MAG: hypothetical protein ACRCT1_07095 [Microcoleaceae cyanobacterium]